MKVAKKRLSIELDDAALQALLSCTTHVREEGESGEGAAARLLDEGLSHGEAPVGLLP